MTLSLIIHYAASRRTESRYWQRRAARERRRGRRYVAGAPCPRCKRGTIVDGYGLMGGGCGLYWFCDRDGCDAFFKIQDEDE